MIQFVLAAPASGSGKTTLTCALLAALKKRGFWPCAFKSGPDYIDPMFHRSALRVDSHNLDLFFSAPDTVRALYAHYAAGHGAALCEGAMGFYDGLNCTTAASAWALADTLGLPVLLVVQPKGASVTLAAQINGLKNFRTPSHLAGILLNDCSPRLHQLLAPLLERETGLPVLGYLPHLPDAVVESRHLGLKTAEEVSGLQEKIERLAEAVSATLDWERLLALTSLPAPVSPLPDFLTPASPTVRIAVAKDEAFCFTYAETLDALRAAGAELVFSAPCTIPPCRRASAGFTCRAATRNCTPRRCVRTNRCAASSAPPSSAVFPPWPNAAASSIWGSRWKMPTAPPIPWRACCRGRASGSANSCGSATPP